MPAASADADSQRQALEKRQAHSGDNLLQDHKNPQENPNGKNQLVNVGISLKVASAIY
jgi:hypothetical protein